VAWGVPQTAIEEIIGASLPEAAMTLKDYAAANELEFETLKPALQTELDKLKP
jgi:lambda repressor-like predicted transcriptional regulator